MRSFYIENLGCAKNTADGNNISSVLMDLGMLPLRTPVDADLIIVNTCGFLQAAVEESIQTILDLIEYKKEKLYVVGCMVERYTGELSKELPEVDLFLGTSQMMEIAKYINYKGKQRVFTKREKKLLSFNYEASHLNDSSYAYVKIAEGCDNRCTYCIIPKLRGDFISRSISDIKNEVTSITKMGIKEVVLVSQDNSRYGIDIGTNLLALLKELEKTDVRWIRLMYLYPDILDDDLINYMAKSSKVLPYVDIPLQHISDSVLKRMNRHTSKGHIISLIKKLRHKIPNITIRSTLIVGFPGESVAEFEELHEFIKNYRIDRLGVFKYSDEKEAAAFKLDGKIDEETKEQRRDIIMLSQKAISEKLIESMVGKVYECVVDEVYDNYIIVRSKHDAPEVDLDIVVYNSDYKVADFVDVKITNAFDGYNLEGEVYELSK